MIHDLFASWARTRRGLLATGLASALAVAATLPAAARAQTAAPPVPRLEGRTTDGQPFRLSALQGKVVLVMFWSTGCAVCRDKMPELRRNHEGWQGQPFELVLVSTDRHASDLAAYDAVISRTVPVRQRFVQLWAGDAGFLDGLGGTRAAQQPATYLVDKRGRVVEAWQGRIPPEAWDRIAELL